MTAHIVEPGYVKLGWKHKPQQRPVLPFTLSRRTTLLLRWRDVVAHHRVARSTRYAARRHTPFDAFVERMVAQEREAARLALAQASVLDIALAMLKRAFVRKYVHKSRTRMGDAERKRNERAAMRQRVIAASNVIDAQARMRFDMSARAHADGGVTND
jgi:hypothetical protein